MRIASKPPPVVASPAAPSSVPTAPWVPLASVHSAAAVPEADSSFSVSSETLAPGAGAPPRAPVAQKPLAALLSRGTAATLTPHSTVQDELGMTHERLNLSHEGVSVFGEQLIRHLDRDGTLTHVTGALPSLPRGLGSGPVKVSADEARTIAREAFAGATDGEPRAERVVVRGEDDRYHAAWSVRLSNTALAGAGGEPRDVSYLVEAHTGEVLMSHSHLGCIMHLPGGSVPSATRASADATAASVLPPSRQGNASTSAHASLSHLLGRQKVPSVPVPARGTSLYSGQVDIVTARRVDGSYTLKDKTRGQGVVTYDGANRPDDLKRLRSSGGKKRFVHDNTLWGEAEADAHNRVAIDAHYGAEMMYDFMKDVLGRDSIDGRGAKLISHVHVTHRDGSPMVNAFWCTDRMVYGDGDGVQSSPLASLDIVGHEIAHGLTQHTAGLLRVSKGQVGALNESFSDIMGMGLKWYTARKNEAVAFSWKVGEEAWRPGEKGVALRYMDEPKKDGASIDHFDDFKPEMSSHYTCGISNNAFYLLVEGGKNPTSGLGVEGGLGMERALKIFGHALTTEMRPNNNFYGARQATLRAATALYGADSEEVRKVGEAWTAVGVRARA